MIVTVTISRNAELWGADDSDQPVVDKAARLLADTIADEIREAYPDAEVAAAAGTTHDGISLRTVCCQGAPSDDVWEDVIGYSERAYDLYDWALRTATA